jgi:ribosome-binding factor A
VDYTFRVEKFHIETDQDKTSPTPLSVFTQPVKHGAKRRSVCQGPKLASGFNLQDFQYLWALKIIRQKMESTRQQKISRLLQKELADIFQKESRTMFMGKMISVTTVRVTPDLSLAKSYISIFPTEDRKEVLKQVRIANPKIRGLLGRRVGKQLRVIPGLEFYIDDSLDYIDNIDRLLKQ